MNKEEGPCSLRGTNRIFCTVLLNFPWS